MTYKKGHIYKIICKIDSNIVYIGSTFTELRKRWAKHKEHYKYNNGILSIHKYFDKYDINNFKIILIKSYLCYQEHKRDYKHISAFETLWINKTKNICVNAVLPFNPVKYIIKNSIFEKNKRKENSKKYRENNKENSKKYRENNKEKLSAQKKEYYNINKEIIAEKSKDYYNNNKERKIENSKDYYNNNKEKVAERAKKYREENKEKLAERAKKYREENKEKLSAQTKKYTDKNKEKKKAYDKI